MPTPDDDPIMSRFRALSDHELVGLLVDDPVARIDVVEFFYREHAGALMAVAIAVVKQSSGCCNADDYDDLASLVVESIAQLLEYGARPHPTFRAVADGAPGCSLELLPYVKQIVRNKIRQRWRRNARRRQLEESLAADAPASNIIYPNFELRSDLAQIRSVIESLSLSAGEREVAAVYLDHFPERPPFPTLCAAMPQRTTKGVRNAEARFMSKLQLGLGR